MDAKAAQKGGPASAKLRQLYAERYDVEPLLTLPEIAMHCRVSTRTVQRWMRRTPPCPAYRNGGRPRFKASEVEHWLRGPGAAFHEGDDE